MKNTRSEALLLAVAVGPLMLVGANAQAGRILSNVRTVAVAEQDVWFNEPVLNNHGEVAFEARQLLRPGGGGGGSGPLLVGGSTFAQVLGVAAVSEAGPTTIGLDNLGLYSEGGGKGLTRIAYAGGVAPGITDDGIFGGFAPSSYPPPFAQTFQSVRLNDSGHTAFRGVVRHSFVTRPSGHTTNVADVAIYRHDHDGLDLVVHEGEQAPRFPAGTLITNLADPFRPILGPNPSLPFSMNERGDIAVAAGVGVPADSGIQHSSGIFAIKSTGEIEAVSVPGDPLPGGSSNSTVVDYFASPAIDQNGDVTYYATRTDDSWGLFFKKSSDLEILGPSQQDIDALRPIFFYDSITYNDLGQVAAVDYFGEMVFSSGSGDLQLIAARGDPVPGTDFTIQAFHPWYLAISNLGATAVQTDLEDVDGESRTEVLLLSEDGEPSLLYAERDAAPGLGGDIRFAAARRPVFNDRGRLAFQAELSDGTRAIFAQDVTGKLQIAARTGDLVDVGNHAGQDLRTIDRLEFGAYPLWNSAFAFNNSGEVLFTAFFEDGTQGLLVANVNAVPEPSAACLVALAGLAMWTVKRFG